MDGHRCYSQTEQNEEIQVSKKVLSSRALQETAGNCKTSNVEGHSIIGSLLLYNAVDGEAEGDEFVAGS